MEESHPSKKSNHKKGSDVASKKEKVSLIDTPVAQKQSKGSPPSIKSKPVVVEKSDLKPKPVKKAKSSKLDDVPSATFTSLISSKSDKEEREIKEEDARNNLYWASSLGLPCLWYGGAPVGSLRLVSVTAFSCQAKDSDIDCCVASTQVSRQNLLPLDHNLLRHRCTNPLLLDLALSLLDFAEWDDSARHDYAWPPFIHRMLTDATALKPWLCKLLVHPLRSVTPNRYKLIMLCLCAEHLGIADEYYEVQSTDTEAAVIHCSRELSHLITRVSSFDSSVVDDFIRHCSRLGSDYQLDSWELPTLQPRPTARRDVSASRCPGETIARDLGVSTSSDPSTHHLTFSCTGAPEEALQEYLTKCRQLATAAIEVGDPVTVPWLPHLADQSKEATSSIMLGAPPSEPPGDPKVILGHSEFEVQRNILAVVIKKHVCPHSLESLFLVSNGLHMWWLASSSCVSLRMPEDRALEVLHDCRYERDRALGRVSAWLQEVPLTAEAAVDLQRDDLNRFGARSPFTERAWLEPDLSRLLILGYSCNANLRRLLKKCNDRSASAPAAAGESEVVVTIQEVIDCYLRMYTQRSLLPVVAAVEHLSGKAGDKFRANNLSHLSIGSSPGPSAGSSGVPVRWPRTLPYNQHHLYWVHQTSTPCICLGLDTSSPASSSSSRANHSVSLRVVVICSSTYHHEIKVPPSALDELTVAELNNCTDNAFALAMIDFYNWEAAKRLPGWDECVWYYYPDFIYNFFRHPPSWSAWRRQVERLARGKREDKRVSYFNGLVCDALLSSDDLSNRIQMGKRLPWNDAVVCDIRVDELEDDAVSVDSEASAEAEAKIDSTASATVDPSPEPDTAPLSSATATPKAKAGKRSVSPVEVDPTPLKKSKQPEPRRWSLSNLYWLPRSSLPCIYYDDYSKEKSEKFTVLPICCATYHYSVDINPRMAEPLTMDLLKQCTDERTQDFTGALLDFKTWEAANGKAAVTEALTEDLSASDVDRLWRHLVSSILVSDFGDQPDEMYHWPSFICQLLQKPREWAAWRKQAERTMSGGSKNRRSAYFSSLKSDYLAHCLEALRLDSLLTAGACDSDDVSEQSAESLESSRLETFTDTYCSLESFNHSAMNHGISV